MQHNHKTDPQPQNRYFLTLRTIPGTVLAPGEKTAVLDRWKSHDSAEYRLEIAVVLNDHSHAVIVPLGKEYTPDSILQNAKRETASAIQSIRKSDADVWKPELEIQPLPAQADFLAKWEYMSTHPVEPGLTAGDPNYHWLYRP